jgi:hypothetical protein
MAGPGQQYTAGGTDLGSPDYFSAEKGYIIVSLVAGEGEETGEDGA